MTWLLVAAGGLAALAAGVKALPVIFGALWRGLRGFVEIGEILPKVLELPERFDRIDRDVAHLHDCLHDHAVWEETTLSSLKEQTSSILQHVQETNGRVGALEVRLDHIEKGVSHHG